MTFTDNGHPVRIGIIGTGFIASGLLMLLESREDMTATKVLTRTDPSLRSDFVAQSLLTNSINEVIDNADLILECSGDPVYGTAALVRVAEAGLPIITMDAELQVTTGSYLARRTFITEAAGDQPGSLAILAQEVREMGFKPLVYGNIKGFLNNTPNQEQMQYWSERQGISLSQVTAATDGTKIQCEQVLVANGLGAGIAQNGLIGIVTDDFQQAAAELAATADQLGYPISDYLVSSPAPVRKLPTGVFITAQHDGRQQPFLEYYKLGKGPYYTLQRPHVLPHFGVFRTLQHFVNGGGALLTNGTLPSLSVAAIAKRELTPGSIIKRGLGSFDVRGIAVRIADNPDHLPIGLMADAVVKAHIEPEQIITFADVELPDSEALAAWRETLQMVRAEHHRTVVADQSGSAA